MGAGCKEGAEMKKGMEVGGSGSQVRKTENFHCKRVNEEIEKFSRMSSLYKGAFAPKQRWECLCCCCFCLFR